MDACAATAELARALADPGCYPHPVSRVETLETHISYVLLAGEFAYKLKKPVKLAFLDYSTLEARRRYCEEELRINRRTAPGIYLGLELVTGSREHPRMGPGQPLLEVAVKMRRFPQEALLSSMARAGTLGPSDIDALAAAVARMHGQAACAASPRGCDAWAAYGREAMANFDDIRRSGVAPALAQRLEALAGWTRSEGAKVSELIVQRAAEGFERECHGDLHLANLVMVDGAPLPFDAIEFSTSLRWIDVACDMAFTVMDLHRHGLAALAARFLDRYLAITGDYGAAPLMRYFMAYRAMVRAKIAALALAQAHGGAAAAAKGEELLACVELAEQLARPGPALVVAMHGLPASGKSTVAEGLLEALGGVRVRSDVERKRLAGLAPGASAAAVPGGGIYGEAQTQATYERLAEVARLAVAGGFPVIVDATFERRAERERFRELARSLGAAFRVVACTAPEAVLRERIARRAREGGDASDAGNAVLEARMRSATPLEPDGDAIVLDTTSPSLASEVAALAQRLAGRTP
jgi:aminoglycoside phosphotransferase family enzyme/predicted kinase